MSERTSVHANFSLAQARHIVKDLFTPVPAIYWADFLLSTFVGMAAFGLVRRVLPLFSVAQGIAFVICGLCFYRAVLFTHELVHFRDKTFTAFRVVWNLLCGIPFLMPSFMYYTHVDHHMRKHFGTKNDGEYLPLGSTPPSHIVLYLCQPFVIPIIAVVRFLLLAPISWVSPAFRDFVHRRASSMVMDPTYIRPLPSRQVLRIFRLQEALCFLWTGSVVVLLTLRIVPIGFLTTAYLVSVFILFMNAVRTLGAHRYTSHGEEATFVEQLLDSINYPRRPFVSALWAPVGLRFHALHHLFPSLPYHNLAKAHVRLMAELPADSPYRQTESTSLFSSLMQLWRTSRAANVHQPRPQTAGTHRLSPAAQSLTRAH
ncbi:MAG TPA: fatty acid desaturase [Pirellulales bacterium]|jgi:fatty acid desaturase|nr:fatty acid desaturase [Pirellulales bacterium]